jgi:hypothetical protein
LKSSNHIAVEGYAYHHCTNLKKSFINCITSNIAVSNRCKCGNDPVYRSGVEAIEVRLDQLILVTVINPSIMIVKHQTISNEQPNASEIMRKEEYKNDQVKNFDIL